MSDAEDSKKTEETPSEAPSNAPAEESALARADDSPSDAEGSVSAEPDAGEELIAAGEVGVEKYVHAAFFAAGILTAYLSGKILQALWNTLAEWPEAVRSVPFLIQYTEEERGSLTLVIGAVLGLVLILRYYRRPSVRSWATGVAGELARVTWPNKETVTNGTIVVLVAGAIATLYIAVLDRLWAYLTNLVYGA